MLSVLRTDILSLGPKVEEFEARLAAFLGVRHAVAVSSGTAGLHLAVRASGLTENSEVITTPFSFAASSNVLLFERATPVFVDIDRGTRNITPDAVEDAIRRLYGTTSRGWVNRRTGRVLAGLLPVDVFGHPVDIAGLQGVARRFGLWLVEDACEALGSDLYSPQARQWFPVGSLADCAVFAFYPNKQLTTAEGGAIVTNDAALADRCRMERNQGRVAGSSWLDHAALGFNYRMDELSAALGVAQMKRFNVLRERRQLVARRYEEALGRIPGVDVPHAEAWARVNWFVYVVRLAPEIDRDALIRFLHARGVVTRPYFPAIHLQPEYRRRYGFTDGMFPVAEAAAAHGLALPFFNRLTRDEIDLISDAVSEGVKSCVITTQTA